MHEKYDEIRILLETSEDEILLALGKQLSGRYAFPPSKEKLREIAQEWFTFRFTDFQKLICTNQQVQFLEKNNDLVELVAAITDIISGICTGISTTTVAVLIVKYGISKLCKDEEVTKL